MNIKTIVWEVNYLSQPKTIRHCKKCGIKTEYISSGQFRVNAQKKSLNIWLLYKCSYCKSTWKLTIFSRINPGSIGQELLDKFTNNDHELAQQYAMDIDLLKKNGADTEMPPYSVFGDEIDFERDIKVKIVSKYSSKIKVSKLLREKLSLSKKTFDEMVSSGIIKLENGADIQKCKLQYNAVVIIFCDIAYSHRQEMIKKN